jgi:hypothetical protein
VSALLIPITFLLSSFSVSLAPNFFIMIDGMFNGQLFDGEEESLGHGAVVLSQSSVVLPSAPPNTSLTDTPNASNNLHRDERQERHLGPSVFLFSVQADASCNRSEIKRSMSEEHTACEYILCLATSIRRLGELRVCRSSRLSSAMHNKRLEILQQEKGRVDHLSAIQWQEL